MYVNDKDFLLRKFPIYQIIIIEQTIKTVGREKLSKKIYALSMNGVCVRMS